MDFPAISVTVSIINCHLSSEAGEVRVPAVPPSRPGDVPVGCATHFGKLRPDH